MQAQTARSKNSQFLRNVAKLSTGKLASLAIAILATPVIARLFAPADFGVAALFIAATAVMATVMPLAYERAVLYPSDEQEAARVLAVALLTGMALTLLLYLVLVLALAVWPELANSAGYPYLLWLFPVAALIQSLRATFVALCMRREDFSGIAIADVTDISTAASSRIAWGAVLGSSVLGLLTGHILAIAVALLFCLYRSRGWLASNFSVPSRDALKTTAREYRDYPVYRAPAKLAFTGSVRLPIIALGMLFPAELVGFYAMANRAVVRPLDAATTSITNVLLRQMLGLRQSEKPVGGMLMKVFGVLVSIGIPMFTLIYLFSADFLAWFLGPKWNPVGRIVQIMVPYFFVLWVGSSASAVFESLRLNKIRLKLNSGNLALKLGVFIYAGIAEIGFESTLRLLVAASCVYQVLVFLIAVRATRKYDGELGGANEAVAGVAT